VTHKCDTGQEVARTVSRSLEGAPEGAINQLADGFPVKQLDHRNRCAIEGCWEVATRMSTRHVKNVMDFVFSSFDWKNYLCETHADEIAQEVRKS
jgi:hypothetical protein